MIRISSLKLPPDHTEEMLRRSIQKKLHLKEDVPFTWTVRRRSVDARKKPRIFFIYQLDVSISGEKKILRKLSKDPDVAPVTEKPYRLPSSGEEQPDGRVVIVGSGPAGLFCALFLARAGYRPILIERGDPVEERRKKVKRFWEDNILDPESNVQFGEWGAGTFSDGKLNTMIKDPDGRIRTVLETFADHGADHEILFSYRPHIGTDVLSGVVTSIREEILRLGGEVLFRHKLADINCRKDSAGYEVLLETPLGRRILNAGVVVLAIGHSARDTFQKLYEKGMRMEAKAFAVGVRIQHPQEMIDEAMYGIDCPYEMEPASYKVTANRDGRGVYSFCMCPGGYVINASSEEGHTAVNGMSEHARDSKMANSAIVVTVFPEDYGTETALDGIAFQRMLEKRAYEAGKGAIPAQRVEDYLSGRRSVQTGNILPAVKGAICMTDLEEIFPRYIHEMIRMGIKEFGKKIEGFDSPDVLLYAAESRTSSPVRILRGEDGQSLSHPGIYPCGEGAGYAGGITSAAVDGIRTAEQIIRRFRPAGPA